MLSLLQLGIYASLTHRLRGGIYGVDDVGLYLLLHAVYRQIEHDAERPNKKCSNYPVNHRYGECATELLNRIRALPRSYASERAALHLLIGEDIGPQ